MEPNPRDGLQPGGGGNSDERDDAVRAWYARCAERGVTIDHTTQAEELVAAASQAATLGAPTVRLAAAAREWGSRAISPVGVLMALNCLRDTLGKRYSASSSHLDLVAEQMTLEAVRAVSASLSEAARTDPLTGCSNRRVLDEDMARAVAGARRSGLDVAVAAIDLDGLKALNDTGGHAAGDAALLGLVDALRSSLRDTDSIYRTGGDEFVVLAPFASAQGATELMHRAQAHPGAPSFSWGVASLSTLSGDQAGTVGAGALLLAADEDLYRRRRAERLGKVAAKRRRRSAMASAAAASAVGAAALAVAVASTGSGPAAPGILHALGAKRFGSKHLTGSGHLLQPGGFSNPSTAVTPQGTLEPAAGGANAGTVRTVTGSHANAAGATSSEQGTLAVDEVPAGSSRAGRSKVSAGTPSTVPAGNVPPAPHPASPAGPGTGAPPGAPSSSAGNGSSGEGQQPASHPDKAKQPEHASGNSKQAQPVMAAKTKGGSKDGSGKGGTSSTTTNAPAVTILADNHLLHLLPGKSLEEVQSMASQVASSAVGSVAHLLGPLVPTAHRGDLGSRLPSG